MSFDKEKYEALQVVIDGLKNEPGALMPIMQKAQDIFGYLPEEVQNYIAKELDIPVSDIYGVATFYAQFTLNPKGKYQISVCLGTACYVKGSGVILEEIQNILGIENGQCTEDGKFSLDAWRCVGACGLAPVMTVNDKVYPAMTPESATALLDELK